MRNRFSIILFLSLSVIAASARVQSGSAIPVLTAGGQNFTNVVVQQVTDTHLFFKHNGGVASVKLMELDPEMQKQFGYNPVKGAQLLNDQAVATASFESRSSGRVPGSAAISAAVAANGLSNATNAPKQGPAHVTKDFPVGKTAKLTLSFPDTWLYDVASSENAGSPALNLRFGPQYGSNFLVLVSTVSASNNITQAGPLKMMGLVANECSVRAVENPVTLQQLIGTEVEGYYFTYTMKSLVDKEPKPGKYRFQTQGMVTVDNLSVCFSALYNYREGWEDKEMLEMIRQLHFSSDISSH